MAPLMNNSVYEPLFKMLPYLQKYLQNWQGKTLYEISQSFVAKTETSISDVASQTIFDMVNPVLGEAVAKKTTQDLQYASRILATHHLGIDCLPEQVQAIHFFGLQHILKSFSLEQQSSTPTNALQVMPVLACSSIPLQSYSYPRGLMPARALPNGQKIHAPLFPSSMQNTLVYNAPVFQRDIVERMSQKWDASLFTPREWNAMQSIVHECILSDICLNLPDLSSQVMYINHAIFKKIYPDNHHLHVVYLNLEKIAKKLIMDDISRRDSVLFSIFFHKESRDRILKSLSGQRACWSKNASNGQVLDRCGSDGTVFFWASDNKGRRIPLAFYDSPPRLCYKDISIPLEPESIYEALNNNLIFPSLFSSFVSLHLEHYLLCYGGVYMVKYLPVILDAVVTVLNEANSPAHMSKYTPFTSLGSGPITVQVKNGISAGSIEILGRDGLTQKHLQSLSELTFDNVIEQSLKEWSMCHLPKAQQTEAWFEELNQTIAPWKGVVL